jgi:SAM-dependent methyltransferase
MDAVGDLDDTLRPESYGERVADVYDDWFPARGAQVAAVAAFLHARAGVAVGEGSGPALELGIGTGRVALPLAALGTPVVGIDASPRMLARLRDKPGGADIPVAVGDFAGVDAPGGPFALVYVVFNTFFALLDQESQVRCLANAAGALRPGGRLVMEAFVPDPARYPNGQHVVAEEMAGEETRLIAATHDPLTQRIRARRLVLGPAGVRTFPVELRYAWPSELDLMARLAGLDLTERWAGWSGEPFTASSRTHVSVWCTRSS